MYYLAVKEETAPVSHNAFAVLMASRSEKHLPSKYTGENIRADRRVYNDIGKVRAVVQCGDCFKPRCVFSETSLKDVEKSMIADLEADFTCGSMLFPLPSEHHSSIVVRVNLSCADNIECATLVKFPPICCYCGAPEEMLVEDDVVRDLKQQKQVVRPICFLCRSQGKEPTTWGATSNKRKRQS